VFEKPRTMLDRPAAAGGRGLPEAAGAVTIRRIASYTFFVGLPLAWVVSWTVNLATYHYGIRAGFDLRGAFLPAAHAVIHGSSPYPALHDPSLASQTAYVYPPFVAFLATPLLLVAPNAAVAVGIAAAFASVVALLWLAGVRDFRCYGLALVWAPTLNAVQNLNISLLIGLALALAWRFRSSTRIAAPLLGCALATKIFVWPLLVWPFACRRRTTFWIALLAGVVLVLGSWAAIGFAGLTEYPRLLRAVTGKEEMQSYSISGALRVAGVGVAVARVAALLMTAGLLAACLAFGRRGDEARAFAAAVLASLTSTPILWQHYLMLLLVALAVTRPRLSVAWFLPVLLWLAPTTGNGTTAQTFLVPIVGALVGAACLLPRRSSATHAPPFRPARLRT